jgi:hypothetical protein
MAFIDAPGRTFSPRSGTSSERIPESYQVLSFVESHVDLGTGWSTAVRRLGHSSLLPRISPLSLRCTNERLHVQLNEST